MKGGGFTIDQIRCFEISVSFLPFHFSLFFPQVRSLTFLILSMSFALSPSLPWRPQRGKSTVIRGTGVAETILYSAVAKAFVEARTRGRPLEKEGIRKTSVSPCVLICERPG